MAVKVRERLKGSGEWRVCIDHQGKSKAKKIGRVKKPFTAIHLSH